MKDIVIKEIAKDLPKSKVKELSSVLDPMVNQLSGMESECNLIISKEINPDVCQEAKTLRLRMVKNRTALDKKRKELKADILLQGNAIQSVYNLYLSVAKPLEDALLSKEKYYELIEEQKKKDLAIKRAEILRNAGIENELVGIDLGDLDNEAWGNLFNGQKALVEQAKRKEAEEQAAIDAEKTKNNLYASRREEIIQYSRFPLFNSLTVDYTEEDFKTLKEALKLQHEEQVEQKKKHDILLDRQKELGELSLCPTALFLKLDTTIDEFKEIKEQCKREKQKADSEKAEMEKFADEKAEKEKAEKELLQASDETLINKAIENLTDLMKLVRSDSSVVKIQKAIEALR